MTSTTHDALRVPAAPRRHRRSILAQRLGEWVGHGPVLEEDIALANVGLDLLGQARLWLTYAGEVEARFAAAGRNEDELAFLRDAGDVPQSAARRAAERQLRRHDGAAVLVRRVASAAAARARALDATRASPRSRPRRRRRSTYHVERSRRLGDPPGRRHRRIAREDAGGDRRPVDVHRRDVRRRRDRARADRRGHRRRCRARCASRGAQHVDAVLGEATLDDAGRRVCMQQGGKRGVHTEHLGHLLAEMQFLQRAYPGAHW